MILQHIRITVVDAGFEPGTSATEVWCAANEPPHLQIFYESALAFYTYFQVEIYLLKNGIENLVVLSL